MTTNEMYMERQRHQLDCKVQALNLCNLVANQIQAPLIEVARAWIGKPIVKAGGVLTERAKPAFEPIKKQFETKGARNGKHESIDIWFRESYGTLRAQIKVCVSSENGCSYQETSAWFGTIEDTGNKLASVPEGVNLCSDRRTDYTAAEIIKVRVLLNQAQNEVRRLQALLNNFGEHDNS